MKEKLKKYGLADEKGAQRLRLVVYGYEVVFSLQMQ